MKNQVSMLDCIKRIPSLLVQIIDRGTDSFIPLFEAFEDRIKQADEIVLVGSGTSYTSAFTARYFAEKAAGIRVTVSVPNEWINDLTVRNDKALYVFLSQTGTSGLTNQALRMAKENNLMTAAISEHKDTTLAKTADVFIDMGCGEEEYPMRTIGYSTSVMTVMMLGIALGKRRGHLTEEACGELLSSAKAAAENIPDVIGRTMDWLTFNRRNMLRADCIVFTGAGALYGVALEGAVKVWETPQIIAVGYELEEGMHGPNFGYNNRHCVIVLNDGGINHDKAIAMCKFMKFEHKNGFIVGPGAVDEQDLAFTPMGKDFACLEFAAVVQVVSYRLAEEQGRDLFAPHDNSAMMRYFNSHDPVNPESADLQ